MPAHVSVHAAMGFFCTLGHVVSYASCFKSNNHDNPADTTKQRYKQGGVSCSGEGSAENTWRHQRWCNHGKQYATEKRMRTSS